MSSRYRYMMLGASLALCGAPVFSSPVMAQERQKPALDEIVITAQKRAQNINDVGITVTAFDAETIKKFRIHESYDIASLTPGLNMVAVSGYSGTANFTLRGVGLNSFSETQEAAVAVYDDEIYLAPLIGSVLGGFDLERIEVLRGPQGTLFGRSASGGLVHYITKKPTKQSEGYVSLQYGSYNERRIDGAYGGALGDTVAVRLAGNYAKNDGWLNNTAGPNQYGEEKWGIRGQVHFTPTENFDVLLRAERAELSNENGVVFLQGNIFRNAEGEILDLPINTNVYGVPGGDFNGFRDTDGDFFTGTWPLAGINDVSRTLLSAKVNWDIGDVTLTSVSGYIDAKKDNLDRNDASPTNFLGVGENPDVTQFVQEIRATGGTKNMKWTVGGFYFNYDVNNVTNILFPSGIAIVGLPPFSFRNDVAQEKESYAAYGQIEYDFTDNLTLIGGLRYETEEVDFSFGQTFSNDFIVGLVLGGPEFFFNQNLNGDLAKIDKDYFSGTLGLDWRVNDNTLLYASLRRGIKPGTFNTPYVALAPEDMRVAEEQVMAYELGAKITLFDGRAQFNASAWYNDYKDYQAVFVEAATTLLTNADAIIYGLDVELQAKPTDRLTVSLAANFLEGNVENIGLGLPGGGIVVRDRELPNAPKYSFNAMAHYEWPMAGGMMSLQGDIVLQGKTYFEVQNHPGLTGDSFSVGNLRLAWSKNDLEVSAFVKNVWEEEYDVYNLEVVDFGGYKVITPGKPRWVGAEIRYRFGN